MKKRQAYDLIKRRARTKLSLGATALLNQLVRSTNTFQNPDASIEEFTAGISIQGLADRCGFKSLTTVCTNLDVLESEGLIIRKPKPEDHNRHCYTVTLEGMWQWPTLFAVTAERQEKKRKYNRTLYAAKKGGVQ